MALSASSVWEVRTAGDDTNGGGFVTGAAGTDYSQQDAKNSGANDKSVTDGVTAGTTTVTSLTANFQTTIVGNIIYIAGGTGAITGAWYQVTARASTTSITVDRATGLSAGTGATINIGGALLTIQKALDLITVVGMQVYVKADGTYSIATGLTDSNGASTTILMGIRGYTTTRTDKGKVTILATAAITMLTASAQGHFWANFIFDGNTATATNGVNVTASRFGLINIIAKNFSGYCVQTSSTTMMYQNNVEMFGAAGTAAFNCASNAITSGRRLNIHDCSVPGIIFTLGTHSIIDSIIETITGATSDAIQMTGHSLTAEHLTIYNIARDGIRSSASQAAAGGLNVSNSIFDTVAGVAIDLTAAGSATAVQPNIENNAYRNNGSDRTGFAAEDGAITLTGIPFTDAPNGDFTLNNTAGAGAACRAAGSPTSIQGATGTGYKDLGAFQHRDSAGSAILIGVSDQLPWIADQVG